MELELKGRNRRTVTNDRREKKKNRRIWSHYRRIEEFGVLSIQWPDRSDPNFCLRVNGKIWSMFLKYLAKMDAKRVKVNALPKVVGFPRVLRFPPTGKVDRVG